MRGLIGGRREELEAVLDPVLLLTEGTSGFAARHLGCVGERVAPCAWPRPLLQVRKVLHDKLLFLGRDFPVVLALHEVQDAFAVLGSAAMAICLVPCEIFFVEEVRVVA